jgi:maltose/moltooligosaccharide transporter
MTNVFNAGLEHGPHAIPAAVRLSFYIGAAAFFTAVLWTILATKEYPPENLEDFHEKKSEKRGIGSHAEEIFTQSAICRRPCNNWRRSSC